MGDMNFAARQFADQARRFSAFINVTKPDPRDRFFLVMGMTGSGKSTFVSRCTGKHATVGHGLYSCTSSIDVFDFTLNGRRIYLVDTPGINDTDRSNIDTLGVLSTYLGASYANGVRIHGIIMLHPISDNRMTGSSVRNIEMMKAMCGFVSYDNLAIATTMWPDRPSYSEAATLEDREVELLADDRYFAALVSRGATVFRHNELGRNDPVDERDSAQRIVGHLIRQSDMHAPEVLQLQREIIDQKKALGETAAGIAVAGDLYKALCIHKRQLGKLEKEMKSSLAKVNAAHAAELQDLKTDLEKKVGKFNEEKRALKKSIKEMHMEEEREWRKKVQMLDRKFRNELAANEQELEDMEESLREIRKDMARRRSQQQAVRDIAEHQKIVSKSREKVVQDRDAYTDFQGQTGNIINGVSNGLAAGITSGVIGAASGVLLCTVM